jgi:cytochrome c oxidase cbb3-type subunit 3
MPTTRLETATLAALTALAVLAGPACRDGDPGGLLPAAAASAERPMLRTSELQAGGPTEDVAARNPYAGDQLALAEGRDLYEGMNCAGCHGPAGGGGIGPPFADRDWIYGDDPENVVESILQGRPNGMPSFAGRLPPESAWKIAAYVEVIAAEGSRKSGTGSEAEVRRGGTAAR